MKKYCKIINGVVVQIQPYEQDGFVECSNDISPGDGWPEQRPSKYHIKIDGKWSTTPDSVNLLRADIKEKLKCKLIIETGELQDKGVPSILKSIRRQLEHGNSNAHKNYIKWGGNRYSPVTEQRMLDFIYGIESCGIDAVDFYNDRADELEDLTVEDLERYNVDLPNNETWPSMPDPNDYVES